MPKDKGNSNELTFSQARREDLQIAIGILNEVGSWLHDEKGITDQWARECPEEPIRRAIESGEFYLIFLESALAGTVILTESMERYWKHIRGNALYLRTLAVKRAYAGQGLGLRIVRWAESMAKEQGKDYLRLDCMAANKRLKQYYIDAGFDSLDEAPKHHWFALFEKRVNSL